MASTFVKRYGTALTAACGFGAAAWLAAAEPVKETSGGTAPAAGEPFRPKLREASDDGLKAMARFRVPAGMKLELWAAEPRLANPVAIWVDERGRVYVAETYRHSEGATDTRGHMNWLDEDLAAKTVADRVEMFKRHSKDQAKSYTRQHDRIRLLEDTDGDGQADRDTVFADGFNGIADGIGAGVLSRGKDVYYACIPHLWKLRDVDNDGVADERTSLADGFGVHVAFIGHDLHGLRLGPDGKLYFTIGDRGANVTTRDGKKIVYPDAGCVFRCEPDGSEMEIYHFGLRNPQELAFDEVGNLFTVDNNSDGGDRARLVHLAEGADSGWRIGYQYIERPNSRGPWNAEKLWHPAWDGQAAYLVPALANYSDGPSGLTFDPGIGLPAAWRKHFFLCDFRGGSGASGVRAFTLKADGATFALDKNEQLLWSVLATDADFGPDGSLYVSDWTEGWSKPMRGRIYRLFDPATANSEPVRSAKKLWAEGLAGKSPVELAEVLRHPDQRLRQEAHLALAERGPAGLPILVAAAKPGEPLLTRIHALWGLGRLSRTLPAAVLEIAPYLKDSDAEVRALAARLAGDCAHPAAYETLVGLLEDPSARVRFFAAQSLGKLRRPEAAGPLLKLLSANADRDRYLRHAAAFALARLDLDPAELKGNDAAEEMGIVLALRQRSSPALAKYLNSAHPRVTAEAARAIWDVPVPEALPALAELADRSDWAAWKDLADPLARRIVAANLRIGTPGSATALARLAATPTLPEAIRRDAVSALTAWAGKPSGRDRVTGLWRPLPELQPAVAVAAALPVWNELVRTAPDALQLDAIEAIGPLTLPTANGDLGPTLAGLFKTPKEAAKIRAAALRALVAGKGAEALTLVRVAVADPSPEVRTAGRELLAKLDAGAALGLLAEALQGENVTERQAAYAVLAEMGKPAADRLLVEALSRLSAGTLPPAEQLDVLLAAEKRNTPELKALLARWTKSLPAGDPLAPHRPTLEGGSRERGRQVFVEKAAVACLRCHVAEGKGGEVGPNLSDIGLREKREYLLEAIVDPNRKIAKGFESVIVNRTDGTVVTGVLRSETPQKLLVITAEGKKIEIPVDEIDERTRGPSAMPDTILKQLSREELRDLIEYLASLKTPLPPAGK